MTHRLSTQPLCLSWALSAWWCPRNVSHKVRTVWPCRFWHIRWVERHEAWKCHNAWAALLMKTTCGIHRSSLCLMLHGYTLCTHTHTHTQINTAQETVVTVCSHVHSRVTCVVRLLARWDRQQLHNSILVRYQIGRPNIGMKTGFAAATSCVCLA